MGRRTSSISAVDRLLATARRVTESLELDTVLAAIVEDARILLRADSGDMLLWDRDHDVLRVVAVSRRPADLLGFEMPFGEGISSQAIRAQQTIRVDEYGTYPHRARALDHYDFGSVICAPLIFRGTALGALNLHATRGGHRFGGEDATLLGAFAGHAAIALDHARRFENEVALGRALADANAELSRSLTVQQALAEQVLGDRGPRGIAEVLAEHLGRRVVIQDDIRRVIAGASPGGGDDWRALLERSGDAAAPLSVPVRVGRDVAGHLLLSAERELGRIDRALVDAAVTGVALEFAKVRASVEVEERLRGEAIGDLLAGTYASEAAVASRAARLGHDLGRRHELFVVDIERAPQDDPREIEGRLVAAAREHLASRALRSLVAAYAGVLVVLAGLPPRRQWDARAVGEGLRIALEAVAGDGRVTVALGGSCERPDAYAPAFVASRRALDVMRRVGRRGGIIDAGELGPYTLLLRASSTDELEAFARGALASLIEHDRRHGTELLETLRVYLAEDRVQRRAAERLYVHVNTVAYRVDRMEHLLGRALDDPTTVFDLTLALRVLDVVEAA